MTILLYEDVKFSRHFEILSHKESCHTRNHVPGNVISVVTLSFNRVYIVEITAMQEYLSFVLENKINTENNAYLFQRFKSKQTKSNQIKLNQIKTN